MMTMNEILDVVKWLVFLQLGVVAGLILLFMMMRTWMQFHQSRKEQTIARISKQLLSLLQHPMPLSGPMIEHFKTHLTEL